MRKALLAVGFIVPAVVGSSFDLARAEDCPNHPDALGTSRVLTVDPGQYPRVGAMDQAAPLPLSDKEVVLTFDDGPVTALFQSNSRHSGRSMRQGHIFPGRRNGS